MFPAELKREIKIMIIGAAVLCIIMYGVFAAFGHYGLDVILGTVLGYIVCTGNYLLLAVTVQKAVDTEDKKRANTMLSASHTVRFILIILIEIIAFKLPGINGIAAVIPLLFPRIVLMFTPKIVKRDSK